MGQQRDMGQEPLVFSVLAFNYKVFAGLCEHPWINKHQSLPNFKTVHKTQTDTNYPQLSTVLNSLSSKLSSCGLSISTNAVHFLFRHLHFTIHFLYCQSLVYLRSSTCAPLASNQTSNSIESLAFAREHDLPLRVRVRRNKLDLN